MLKYLLLFLACSAYAQDTLTVNVAIQEYPVNTWVSADSIMPSPWARLYIQNDTLKVVFSDGTGVIDSTAKLFFEHIEAYSRQKSIVVLRIPEGSPICVDELRPSVRLEIWRCDTIAGVLTNCRLGTVVENSLITGNGTKHRKSND